MELNNKKDKLLSVEVDLSKPITRQIIQKQQSISDISIMDALAIVLRQMAVSGRRKRTLHSMEQDVKSYATVTKQINLSEISTESIYEWLFSFEGVKDITRRSRLKTLKSFLTKCFDNSWLPVKFWSSISIKVDEPEKYGAKKSDVELLLSLLDVTDFVQLRDATAVILIYQTGIRLATLAGLERSHVDLEGGYLNLTADIMKNHKPFKVPISDKAIQYLSVLMDVNDKIRQHTKDKNDYVFISRRGSSVQSSPTHNAIQVRLTNYSKQYHLENINAHALRRGFAMNLLHKGASIPLISKALAHGDLAVTTKYLNLNKDEVAEELKGYLHEREEEF